MFQMQRSRKLSKVGIGLIIGLMALSVFGQTQNSDTRQLLPNQTVERELKGGEVHAYRITLAAGQYLKAVTEQRGIDVVVTLFAADGKKLLEVDSPNGTQGPEPLSLVAEASGTYRLEVRSLENEASAGRYEVKVLEVRSATPQDKPRIAAERAYAEGELLFNQATADSLRGAIAKYEEALPLWRGLKEYDKEAETLLSIGATYSRLSEMRKALGYLNQALVLFRYLGDRSREARTLHDIGSVYDKMDEKQKALDYYDKSLSIYRSIGDKSGEATMLESIGSTYEDLANNQKQLEYYNQSLSIYKSIENKNIEDKYKEANLLKNLGHYFYKYKDEKWFDYYNQALTIFRNTNYMADELWTLRFIAAGFEKSGEYQKALEYYNQALSLFESSKENRSAYSLKSGTFALGQKTFILLAIGSLYGRLGNEKKKSEYLNQVALLSKTPSNSKSSEALSSSTKGLAYQLQKDFQKALEQHSQSLTLYREIGDKEAEIRQLITISRIYVKLGDKQKMLDYEKQALAQLKDFNNDNFKSSIFSSIGNNYKDIGDNQKALEFYNQALSLNKGNVGLVGWYNLAVLLKNIGQVYEALNEKQKAIESYNQTLQIFRAKGHKYQIGESLELIGDVYLSLKDYQKAIDYYTQALQLYKTGGNREQAANILSGNMSASQLQGNNKLAILYGKQSVNIYQEIRQSVRGIDEETRQSYAKKVEPTYRKLADILINEGRLPEAQAVLNLLKEEEYEQLARSDEKGETIPYSQAEAEVIKKIENLVALESERTELQKLQTLTKEQEARLEQLRLGIAAANGAFDVALDVLGKAESSASVRVDEIKTSQEIQSALGSLSKETKSGVVALYTVLGMEEEKEAGGKPVKGKSKTKFGWVIMVREKGYKAYPIDVENLNDLVFQFRDALTSDKYNPQPLAEKIYTAIFRQTSPKLKRTLEADLSDYLKPYKDKTIMWSLDGVLRYIPMAALHDGKQYLVENYRNVVFTKQEPVNKFV